LARRETHEKRRSDLRRAAARAIAARGTTGISLRDIAQEANVAPSSVLYYYRDLDEVVGDAIQHAIERFYDRRHENAEGYRDPREQLVAAIISGLPTGKDDLDVLLLYLGIPVIRRSSAIAALARSLTARQRSLYRWILDVGAARDVFTLTDDVATIATNLVALEDAYGLYVINGSEDRIGSYVAFTVAYASTSTSCDLGPTLASMWVDGDGHVAPDDEIATAAVTSSVDGSSGSGPLG
jgi:AcrR family transcriptional regulator